MTEMHNSVITCQLWPTFQTLSGETEAKAIKVTNDSQSIAIEGARMVANHFMKIKDYTSAIKFIIISK